MSALPSGPKRVAPQDHPWTDPLRALSRRIEAHQFATADRLSFIHRLARDHDWSISFAQGAVLEYGRFCFLAASTSDPVTPSEEVDEVWHLHLTYSRDYWTVWCPDVLRTDLHHDPTKGGVAEQSRFQAQYARTLATYEVFFGPPPPLFWPATHRRFGARPRFRTVDTGRSIVLPHPANLLWRGR
jgi:hypothetical protein